MKRVRIDDGWLEHGTKSRRPRAFVYKPKKKTGTASPKPDLEPADPVFVSIMKDIRADRASWAKLERYLRPRVRVRMKG